MSTVSKSLASSRKISAALSEPSSSAGFEGLGPVPSRVSPGVLVASTHVAANSLFADAGLRLHIRPAHSHCLLVARTTKGAVACKGRRLNRKRAHEDPRHGEMTPL